MGEVIRKVGAILVALVALLLVALCVLVATDDGAKHEPEPLHVALTSAAALCTLAIALVGVVRRSSKATVAAGVLDVIVFLAIGAIIGGTG